MRALPEWPGSLAYELPASRPGTIFVLGPDGGVSLEARPDATVTFGRNEPEVDVCVGVADDRVSRRHGVLVCDGRNWTLCNVGRLPIRLPHSQLIFPDSAPVQLPDGYTPIFIRSRPDREHLLEIRVAGPVGAAPRVPGAQTEISDNWTLLPDERLVLVVLGQRYLRHEAHPQPLSWRQVSDELAEIRPGGGWTAKRCEHIGVAVRKRLSRAGISGLTRDEVGDPVGNALNHNLLVELVSSATLVPPDLRMLDEIEETDEIIEEPPPG